MRRPHRSASRHTVRGAAASCALAVLGGAMAPSVPFENPDPAGPAAFARTVTELAEILLCAVSCWLAVATALLVVASVSSRGSLPARLAVRVTPLVWRRILAIALGGAIVLAPATADAATPAGGDDPRIAGLRLPDRPSGEPRAERGEVVRVRPGDTLWDIASSRLPPGADDAARAAACRRWYAANRAVIGADPDLLLPGTPLRPPYERTNR
ncbi:MAG: hypothetical protein ACRDO7_03715 [Nocardioidaceae bacterium]